ncbi:bile acid:sodium symporter family protein [uncultured Sutterella sp.]|uniref:bile acid:sodium symporter family protein n=1 Tax=uncultured Sutterella sp. TaxID=286133 RepID=UPI0025901C70|nr:bile acid:sodium symporter family protein [uncultured Sutterella sp.]
MLSRFANKTFALWVIIAGILGFVFPDVFKPIGSWIAILLGVMMFGMGLTLTTADFREIFRRPKDVFVGILAQFLARGDVALSVTITSCTTLLAPLVTPALMYFFANQWIAINPTAMFLSIVQVILLPIAAGVVVHKVFGKKADQASVVLPFVSVATAVVIIAAVVAATRGQFLSAGLTVFAVVVLQNAFGMGLGFLAGRLFGMDVAKCKALCFEVGMQNSALGVTLATVHFAASPMTALPSAVGALWHNVSGAVVASFFQKLRGNGEKKTFFEVLEENAAAKKHAANASHKAAA